VVRTAPAWKISIHDAMRCDAIASGRHCATRDGRTNERTDGRRDDWDNACETRGFVCVYIYIERECVRDVRCVVCVESIHQ